MRGACIDIGSNTIRLLVADAQPGAVVPVFEQKAYTRIGHDLGDGDLISAAKGQEVVATVAEQVAAAHAYGAQTIRAVATAAVRRASNGPALAAEIERCTGLAVDVLSDRDEATLAFTGAIGMEGGGAPGPLGVVDVGGGSSEIVVGHAPAQIDWWVSLPLGSGAAALRQLTDQPRDTAAQAAARAAIDAAVGALDPPPVTRVLAVGGSATSLCRLAGETLDAPALSRALSLLVTEPAGAVSRRFGIDLQRVALLPAGLLILEAIGRRLRAPITVGRGGLREGVLMAAARG